MTISDHNCRPPKAVDAEVTPDSLKVLLDDGRAISVPRAWYPRLEHGKANELRHFRLVGTGEAIHWPDLDEDIGIEGLLAGRRSAESPKSLQKWLESRGQASAPVSSTQNSKGKAGARKKADRRIYVEQRPEGDYAVRRGDSERASAVAPTQREAIAIAREINPGASPLVERVRNVTAGGRDKWRSA